MPYLERLKVPWWMWGLTLGVAALLAVQIGLGVPGARTWVPLALVLPLAVAGLWWLGRIKVQVRDGELWVDDAHLPVKFISDVIPLDRDDRRLLLGPGADPLAFVVQRPWIKGTVQIVLNDPDDPTPYWVISTRSPERLTELIRAAG
ncbi:MAG TPA: DUF3093 domain-containing protein [Candidatus Limnocylindrales bacterium]|nr:DUF3093 domain-containing protein [Candidatus Limnocylindrales bacterium]